jgi:leucyl aminopeptidase
LPYENYIKEKTTSKIADLENLNRWIYAWSTMWAAFLSNFILNNEKYTHIDIAWTALKRFWNILICKCMNDWFLSRFY